MRLKMKKSLNNQKGVSLTSLAVAIIVILILTSVTLYNATGNIKISKLKGMQTDIENLTDRVSSYYAQYGKLPVNTNIEYTNEKVKKYISRNKSSVSGFLWGEQRLLHVHFVS